MKKILIIITVIFLIIGCGNIVSATLPQEHSSYDTRELSRDENYKIIEMYVYDDNSKITRRITFELPIDWHVDDSSVFFDNEYKSKVDMWNIISTTREDVLNELDNQVETGESYNIVDKTIYSTENYEIIYYKLKGEGDANIIYSYYLYANGERFHMSSYVFDEDKSEYNDNFKRIAESVKFQFDVNEVTSSPATGDNISAYAIILITVVILMQCHRKSAVWTQARKY